MESGLERSWPHESQGGVPMIKVEHLTKKYGEVLALDDLSFEIEEG